MENFCKLRLFVFMIMFLSLFTLTFSPDFEVGNKSNLSQAPYLKIDGSTGNIGFFTNTSAYKFFVNSRAYINGILNVSGNRITNVGTPIASTDAVTKAYVDAAGGSGSSVSFEGFTTANYTGDMRGFPGANAKCNAAFSGSHMCSYEELFNSNTATTMERAWLHNGFASLNESCNYLTSNASSIGNSTDLIVYDGTTSDGSWIDMEIGSDGNPVIVFWNESGSADSAVMVLCDDPDCSSNTYKRVGSSSGTNYGQFPALAINSNGNPVFAYIDSSDHVMLYTCDDASCSSGTETTVDSSSTFRVFDLEIASDSGYPLIATWDGTNNYLTVHDCSNAVCSSKSSRTLHTGDYSGQHDIDMEIGSDGNPILVYKEGNTDNDFELTHCPDPSCADTPKRIITFDYNHVSEHAAIEIAPDGYPVIAYTMNSRKLGYIKCYSHDCYQFENKTLLYNSHFGTNVDRLDIAIGPDNFPLISYYDDSAGNLMLYDCDNIECSSGTLRTLVDEYSAGVYNSIAVNNEGEILIAYYIDSNQDAPRLFKYTPTYEGFSIDSNALLSSSTVCSTSYPIACCS